MLNPHLNESQSAFPLSLLNIAVKVCMFPIMIPHVICMYTFLPLFLYFSILITDFDLSDDGIFIFRNITSKFLTMTLKTIYLYYLLLDCVLSKPVMFDCVYVYTEEDYWYPGRDIF